MRRAIEKLVRKGSVAVVFCALFGPSAAMGQIVVVDHQPHPFGGGASDTLFVGPSGQPVWQRNADDFMLTAGDTIGTIKWWGFYNADNPPATETMRIRFYGARPGDGLPDDGNILYETSVQDHTRTWTGRLIAVGDLPREYLFQSALPTPVWLDAGTKYWLEIVQMGDLATYFRWENSSAQLNGHAFINDITLDWRATLPGSTADSAFQLIAVPEPAVSVLFGLVSAAGFLRRGKRGCRG
jgi:hypothetical protein